MDLNKIKIVLSDKKYVESLLQLETPQEVQACLKEKDIELSIDEINQIADYINRYENDALTDQEKQLFNSFQNDGELSDDQLETVSGGFIEYLVFICACAIISTVITGIGVHQKTRGRW